MLWLKSFYEDDIQPEIQVPTQANISCAEFSLFSPHLFLAYAEVIFNVCLFVCLFLFLFLYKLKNVLNANHDDASL